MRFKKIMLLTIILAFLVAVSAVNAAENATDDIIGSDVNEDSVSVGQTTDEIVSVENDDIVSDINENVLNSNSKTFTDLNNAINGNDDSDVYLDGNYAFISGTDDNFIDGVVVDRSVTVWGNGYSISGEGAARIFSVDSDNVVFRDIIFINGTSTGDGGAINGYCHAINCAFTGNLAEFGGALYGGSATNCTFTNNCAYDDGGAIWGGSAINCTFINNQAYDDGGAIWGGSATNCTFTGNQGNYGGAICGEYFTATNCIFTDNQGTYGGAACGVSAINCTFTNNTANDEGGAMYGGDYTATNCIFTGNQAIWVGGAMEDGSATNCTFTDNKAGYYGGAMHVGSAISCQFINNTATNGGATYQTTAINSNFTNNAATEYGGAMYGGNTFCCIFKGNKADISGDDTYDTEVPKPVLSVSNFNSTYGSSDKLLFNLTITSGMTINNANITLRVYKGSSLVGTYYALSGEGWIVGLDPGSYIAVCAVENQGYDVDPVYSTINIRKIPSTLTVNDMAFDYGSVGSAVVSFTGAEGVVAEVLDQPNAVVNVSANNITVSNLGAGTYVLSVTTIVDDYHNNITKTAAITVNKLKTQFTAIAVTATYNINKNLVIALKDSKGNALNGFKVSININGAKTYTTDKNGQVKINVANLVPKAYTAKISFAGNAGYKASTKSVKITVKKATAKFVAKDKAFKLADKTKKYVVIFKDNNNKVLKSKMVYIKVAGITYSAKTDAKGQATFKLAKLKKAGSFNARLTFKGDAYYNKCSKTVKIVVKK